MMRDNEKKIAQRFPDLQIGDFEADGKNIHYVRLGSGTPVVLLHGANMGWGSWLHNMESLAQHFTVYALDIPGAGWSTYVDYKKINLEEHIVKPIAAFVRNFDLQNAAVIGHSFGGWLAMKLAAAEPSRITKVVVVDPLGFSSKLPPGQFPITVAPLMRFISQVPLRATKKNMKKFIQSTFYGKIDVDDDFLEYYLPLVSRHPMFHPLAFLHGLTVTGALRPDLSLQAINVHQPVLAIWGTKDKMIPFATSADMLARKSNIRVELFEDTGHVSLMEQPEKFNNIVTQFILNHV